MTVYFWQVDVTISFDTDKDKFKQAVKATFGTFKRNRNAEVMIYSNLFV